MRNRFHEVLAIAILACGVAVGSARADGTVLTQTFVNNTGAPYGFLLVRYSAADLHDPVLISNPSLCPPPEFVIVTTDRQSVVIRWPCSCVQPGQSVTFSVHTLSGASAVSVEPAPTSTCPGVWATTARVTDTNGDLDGFPDTNETFELRLGVSNKWTVDLTNVVARLSSADPRVDCVLTPTVNLGTIPARTDVEAALPFRLHVHPNADRGGPGVSCLAPGPGGTCSNFVGVPGGCTSDAQCRRSAFEEYAAKIDVTFTADQPGVQTHPQSLLLQLDLDSTHPAGATSSFTESFEAAFGFGNFTFQNLDDAKATNALSDGYRCQYSDPDFANSNSYGEAECYLGFAGGQSPVNAWHVHSTSAPDGGRAYVGQRSAHYGSHAAGNPALDTTMLSQLDGLRLSNPIHLAARVCQSDPSANKRACGTAADCAPIGGGPCVAASPELSFKQQISLVDSRRTPTPEGESFDRAIVQVLVDGASVWQKIAPYRNIYDKRATDRFSNCLFDPIDDGNTEDDYFDPADPARRLGPSSTCFPEIVFGYQGDTDAPFDPTAVGRASDPPGLAGNLGIGTWMETRFDLSRFRGRSIRIRYLFTSIKLSDIASHEAGFMWNPTPEDDGWYIDDVRVTQTLGSAPVPSPDNADNSGLPGNLDGDVRGDDCDCAPTDPGSFARPDIRGLRVGADKQTLFWDSTVPSAGTATVHDVMRGAIHELPVGAGASETCLASGIAAATLADAAVPATGRGFYYLVRGVNACSTGEYGFRSNGMPRTSAACP